MEGRKQWHVIARNFHHVPFSFCGKGNFISRTPFGNHNIYNTGTTDHCKKPLPTYPCPFTSSSLVQTQSSCYARICKDQVFSSIVIRSKNRYALNLYYSQAVTVIRKSSIPPVA
jgi:hypothetical protein